MIQTYASNSVESCDQYLGLYRLCTNLRSDDHIVNSGVGMRSSKYLSCLVLKHLDIEINFTFASCDFFTYFGEIDQGFGNINVPNKCNRI